MLQCDVQLLTEQRDERTLKCEELQRRLLEAERAVAIALEDGARTKRKLTLALTKEPPGTIGLQNLHETAFTSAPAVSAVSAVSAVPAVPAVSAKDPRVTLKELQEEELQRIVQDLQSQLRTLQSQLEDKVDEIKASDLARGEAHSALVEAQRQLQEAFERERESKLEIERLEQSLLRSKQSPILTEEAVRSISSVQSINLINSSGINSSGINRSGINSSGINSSDVDRSGTGELWVDTFQDAANGSILESQNPSTALSQNLRIVGDESLFDARDHSIKELSVIQVT